MIILSIDCAGSGCGVCVWKDGTVLSNLQETMGRGQDQRLMPMILEVLAQAKISFDQLNRIAVTRGPGSFTGLRIGLAAARAIGLAANKPVLGIDRLQIYCEQFAPQKKDIFVILNSRRKELYCRFFSASGEIRQPAMMTMEEIAALLKDRNNLIVTGDMPESHIHYHPAAEAEHISTARIAASADLANPEYAPRPLYIRAPDVTMPKNKSGLRVLTINDAPKLAALHALSFPHGAWNETQIQSSLALASTRGWGVFENDKPLGFILCQIIPGQSEILTLAVDSNHRHKGIAIQLVQTAVDVTKLTGTHLFLDVAADNNAALSLYKKLGFEQSGRRAGYYQNGKVDAVLLTLHT